ncbi:MAG: DMT family transporter, partial [Bryobacteraceae bacterium]
MGYLGELPPMPGRAMNRLLVLAAALLFSTGGAAIKATLFGPWQVAGFRSAVATLSVFALVAGARRGWSWRVLPAAAAYASTLILFVMATKLTTAANAIFLQSTAPVYVLLAGPLLLGERVRRSDLAFAAVVAFGLALFFVSREGAVATAPDPLRGNVCALLSGVAWAATLIALRWLGKRSGGEGALATIVAGNALAFAVCLPMALPVTSARATDLLVIAYLGLFQIGLAYYCLTRAIRHVPAFETSTLLLAEPVLNPVWAWLIHGERPAAWALAGGAVILSATALHTWRE